MFYDSASCCEFCTWSSAWQTEGVIECATILKLKLEGILKPVSLWLRSSVADAPVTVTNGDFYCNPLVDSLRFGSSSDWNWVGVA